ncbi:methionyl-tRNA formyltransferase, partial [Candidatus Curtissbacteria bacterium]|nr:methionyl-tRNA formyltransferase [Candidatus Curtissbacteria bacterium]
MKIIFFGTPRFAQIVLEKLTDSPFRPTLVITAPDAKSGRGRNLQASPVKQTAVKNRIEVLGPKSLSDPNFQFKISNLKFDLAILVAYGKIIPSNILKLPRLGFVNVHPSLLPKYRGPSPIISAILAGEEKTGISIMLLDEKVDHGPILAQHEVPIDKDDTHASLIEKLAEIGAQLLIETLPYYTSGDLAPAPQNHKEATNTQHIKKSAGAIDLENPPNPQTFDRMIRAYYPWPTVWTQLRQGSDGQAKILKFLPSNTPNEPFLIQPEGKKPMTVKEFKNGYPEIFKKISQIFEGPKEEVLSLRL